MMKIWKIYEEIKEKAGVEKVDPENIQKIREVLSFPSLEEIAKKQGVEDRRSLKQLDLLLFRFLKDPTPKQKAILYYLFKKSNLPTSLTAVHKKLGFGTAYSCDRFLSAKILEDMGLIRLRVIFKGNHKFSINDINRQRFKEFWPEIEEWGALKGNKKENFKKTKKGEQMGRAFAIFNERLKGRKFPLEVLEIIREELIDELSRGDYHERGWEIFPRVFCKLKKRLLKMPINKFISRLEGAEENSAFLFTINEI